jgi:hypothetical protein
MPLAAQSMSRQDLAVTSATLSLTIPAGANQAVVVFETAAARVTWDVGQTTPNPSSSPPVGVLLLAGEGVDFSDGDESQALANFRFTRESLDGVVHIEYRKI